jgi:HAD superfamily hydrolase (TIGR01490 family)
MLPVSISSLHYLILEHAVTLAIFDLDNTLIAGDSDHSWGQFLVDNKLVDVDAYQQANDRFYQDYERGELDINAYLRFSLQPLMQYSRAELDALHLRFMAEVITPLRLSKAEALLNEHRALGHYLLIITSTNGFITEPIARALKVDHILATDAEVINGNYSGEIAGIPCYQEGKIVRFEQWLAETGQDASGAFFYSDSINDLPLLAQVDNPIAVDPDDALRCEADARGWKIISLRD